MKQVNGEVRLLIIMTMIFVFMVPVGFLVIATASDRHDQEDLRERGGAQEVEEIEDEIEVAPDTDNEDMPASSDDNGAEDNTDEDTTEMDEGTDSDGSETGMESETSPD